LDNSDSAVQASDGISLVEAQKMGLVTWEDMSLPESSNAKAPLKETTPTAEADVGELADLFTTLEAADNEVDLDAFWDSALDDGDAGIPTRGISFEDAVKQGLLSNDFDLKE
jgi:hypothetical protein